MYRWPVTTVNNSVNGASENFTVTFHDTRYSRMLAAFYLFCLGAPTLSPPPPSPCHHGVCQE